MAAARALYPEGLGLRLQETLTTRAGSTASPGRRLCGDSSAGLFRRSSSRPGKKRGDRLRSDDEQRLDARLPFRFTPSGPNPTGPCNRSLPQPLSTPMNPHLAFACLASLAAFAPTLTAAEPPPSAEWQIKTAVLAAPKAEQEAVTVLGYDATGKLVTLRQGTGVGLQ